MAKNRNNGGRPRTPARQPAAARTSAVAAPAQPETASEETPVEESQDPTQIETNGEAPKVIEDTLTTHAQTPAAEEPVEEVVESTASVLDISEEDNRVITELKRRLSVFKTAVSAPGTEPKDFQAASAEAYAITKLIIQFPKRPVLNALLTFFIEEKDGVCSADMFMRGSTMLAPKDEQQVGFLYGLFSGIANRRLTPVDQNTVIRILKKPEIFGWYIQRANAIKHGRQG